MAAHEVGAAFAGDLPHPSCGADHSIPVIRGPQQLLTRRSIVISIPKWEAGYSTEQGFAAKLISRTN
jgi:hypothetical protein